MFEFCADPQSLEGLSWLACYTTTPKHMQFYWSFGVVLLMLALVAPMALAFGLIGAMASRAASFVLRWPARIYLAMVRGVPDIVFFLFVPIALDQALEYLRHKVLCPDVLEPIRQGNDFVVCQAAKLPLNSAPQWIHEMYGFGLAVLAFGFVYGAFAGNVIAGAMAAVPKSQLETAAAYGMTQRQIFFRILMPQMWLYALPGLSNIWLLLIKATPLLFLLGIKDIVYWARELGSTKLAQFHTYAHPDWLLWYCLVLLVFYLLLTWVSQLGLDRVNRRLMKGQAILESRGEI